MFQIIALFLVICIIVWLVKKVGGFVLKIFKGILTAIGVCLYILTALPIVICTKALFLITKVLHIQTFIYTLLSLSNLSSFLYWAFIHVPYTKKEKYIDCKKFFCEKKINRYNTIAIAFFTFLEGAILIYLSELDKFIELQSFFLYTGIAYLVVSLMYAFFKISEWNTENKKLYDKFMEWKTWLKQDSYRISEFEFENALISACSELEETDTNSKRFNFENIPFGRATAFISYFNKNLENEEPLYFSVKMSSNEDELREYGILLTTKGLYISTQEGEDIEIPFYGLWKIAHSEKEGEYIFDYGLSYGELKVIKVCSDILTLDMEVLVQTLTKMNMYFLAMIQGNIVSELDEVFEDYEKERVRKTEDNFEKKQNTKTFTKAAELGGIGVGLSRNAYIQDNEVKSYMNGARGGGYAAEYGNNAIDRITGNRVKNVAQELENGHQKLHGADRNVNGVNIQTKYYKTASESIGAAFEHKQAIYLNDDGSMMQIEVPRDQYNQAVSEMQKRIKSGQVPGESNPENAKKYVRKGHFTYTQANNIALAGSIEGIAVDISQGIVCSLPGAGITVVLSFASAVWNGQDLKAAAKQSAISGLKVMGKSTAIYVLTMQLSRDKIVNIFAPKIMVGEPGKQVVKSLNYVNNPIFSAAEKTAEKISSSTLANTKVGKALNLDKVTGRQVIAGTVTVAVVYGPDVCRALQGKISGKQLIKNTTVNTAGLVGAALGAAIPIPIVGSMVGGAVASFVAKKIMDNFIEDDAVEMFRIMREEFLDIVMLYAFSKDEFNLIVSETIGNPKMSNVLQSMYQSGAPKDYADALINAEVQKVLSCREKITYEQIETGMKLLLEDESVA